MSEQFPRIEQRENGKAVLVYQNDDGRKVEADLDSLGTSSLGIPFVLLNHLSWLTDQGYRADSIPTLRLIAEYGAAMMARGLVYEQWMGSR